MKVHKSGDHFITVDCNENLPYADSLEKRTLRNTHMHCSGVKTWSCSCSNNIKSNHVSIRHYLCLKKIKKSHKPLKNSLIGKLCMFHFMFTPL